LTNETTTAHLEKEEARSQEKKEPAAISRKKKGSDFRGGEESVQTPTDFFYEPLIVEGRV